MQVGAPREKFGEANFLGVALRRGKSSVTCSGRGVPQLSRL
eukprot:SAG11_NODE_31457_length_291_cov_2.588542_1_plen_40_part_01